MSLSQNIKRYREAHNISQECMGFRLHMDQSAYSRLERRCDTCAKRLPQIAKALDTTSDVLRSYHETPDAAMESEVSQTVVSVEELLQQKEEQLKRQAEEILFLRRQVSYQQAVWHQYCGGGGNRVVRLLVNG